MAITNFPKPENFPYDKVFYFDGVTAMMIGVYKNQNHKSIGLRWTEAESEYGYPNSRGKGMWMVVPTKLALHILEGINRELKDELKKRNIKSEIEFKRALSVIKELNER